MQFPGETYTSQKQPTKVKTKFTEQADISIFHFEAFGYEKIKHLNSRFIGLAVKLMFIDNSIWFNIQNCCSK